MNVCVCLSAAGEKKSIRYMKVRVKKETSCPLLSASVSLFKATDATAPYLAFSQFNLIPLQTFEHGLLFFSNFSAFFNDIVSTIPGNSFPPFFRL